MLLSPTQGSSRRVEDLRLVTLGRQSFETSITRVRPQPSLSFSLVRDRSAGFMIGCHACERGADILLAAVDSTN
jgi:hypothetical protein